MTGKSVVSETKTYLGFCDGVPAMGQQVLHSQEEGRLGLQANATTFITTTNTSSVATISIMASSSSSP